MASQLTQLPCGTTQNLNAYELIAIVVNDDTAIGTDFHS
jgi:hypothetical protein